MGLTVDDISDYAFTRAQLLAARASDTDERRRELRDAHNATRYAHTPARVCPTCGYSLDGAHKNRIYCSRRCQGGTHRDDTKWDGDCARSRAKSASVWEYMKRARRRALLTSWRLRVEMWFPEFEPVTQRKAARVLADQVSVKHRETSPPTASSRGNGGTPLRKRHPGGG